MNAWRCEEIRDNQNNPEFSTRPYVYCFPPYLPSAQNELRKWVCQLSSARLIQTVRYQSSWKSLKWPSSLVRQTFIDYFVKHGHHPHKIIPSSSVIPPKDAGTYFVNSGMNQFKNIFLSAHESMSHPCVVNHQKCIRVGGKHNDLSDVGHDTYHHTFFEMLGNWAFNGAYFKREACQMAFDLLTKVYRIDKNRLFFTYFKGESNLIQPDLETKQIWLDLGVDQSRVLPFGMKDNFWEMGEIGPCGPCTEIHYDHTGSADPTQVNRDNPKVVEIWNLVFMQYERRHDQSLAPLAHFHVDTGMGLERLVAVLNELESNYDTDLFMPLFETIHSYCPRSAGIPAYSQANERQQYAYRLLADHARMFTVAIGDGLVPDKKGIAGLLKKMIERATRIAHEHLHIEENQVAILSKLIPIVTDILAPAYPELKDKQMSTSELVKYYELNSMKKYEMAKPLMENFVKTQLQNAKKNVSGNDIFRLYSGKIDGVNIPLEMIEDYDRLNPTLKFEWSDFDALMNEESRKSKLYSVYNKTIKSQQTALQHPLEQLTDLVRENSLMNSETIDEPFKYQIEEDLTANLQLAIQLNENKSLNKVEKVNKTNKYYLLLDRTNFYSTAGGQSSDHGTIRFDDNLIFHVEDVIQVQEHILHYGNFLSDSQIVEKTVLCQVDRNRRLNLSRNHTTTHLVNRVLREILQDSNLIQKASLIHEDFFIFEYASISDQQSNKIFEQLEKRVNEIIRLDLPVEAKKANFDDIRSNSKIYRLTNESYPSEVRCLSIGSSFSQELCCGTHVSSTREIQDFLLVRVDSRGRSNRRLYGVTGSFAENVRHNFENGFLKRFQHLEQNQNEIQLDEMFGAARKLRENYFDERSLNFPYNERQNYFPRLLNLIPDKKLLRKYLVKQLSDDLNRSFIQSNADLPIYEIGFMLLHYDDPTNSRQNQPFVVYFNSNQRWMIVYLKNPRQRNQLVEFVTNRWNFDLFEDFHHFDQQTQDLFRTTKKLAVFRMKNDQDFDRLNFDRISNELLSTRF